ncbi:MAG: efflux RND transporter periplasmic adaptor subunit [Alphaproteobacteria bacterium]|nr:efflux RND transporter periplasmic adaptor subunit [Alphaproteobacteria bacterium]
MLRRRLVIVFVGLIVAGSVAAWHGAARWPIGQIAEFWPIGQIAAHWPLGQGTSAQNAALTLHGNVDIRQVDLSFNTEGRLALMLLEEGDAVVKGQRLAQLDTGYHQDAVVMARARRDGQRTAVDKLEAGSRPEEIDRARANLAQAEAQVVGTRATFQRQEQLALTSAASVQARDDARTALAMATARRDSASQDLRLAVLGPRREDIAAGRAQLQADEATLALAERHLADTNLFAPESGTILTRIREPGAVLTVGNPVYTLALSSPVWVRAYVSEPELGRVHPGMAARVFTDSRPEKPYEGQIGFISPTAEFTPKAVETEDLRTSLVYRLRVVVNHPDAGLRQGMPVTVVLE